jgi:hypothetical protein
MINFFKDLGGVSWIEINEILDGKLERKKKVSKELVKAFFKFVVIAS